MKAGSVTPKCLNPRNLLSLSLSNASPFCFGIVGSLGARSRPTNNDAGTDVAGSRFARHVQGRSRQAERRPARRAFARVAGSAVWLAADRPDLLSSMQTADRDRD